MSPERRIETLRAIDLSGNPERLAELGYTADELAEIEQTGFAYRLDDGHWQLSTLGEMEIGYYEDDPELDSANGSIGLAA